jgi:hypothetical protein
MTLIVCSDLQPVVTAYFEEVSKCEAGYLTEVKSITDKIQQLKTNLIQKLHLLFPTDKRFGK